MEEDGLKRDEKGQFLPGTAPGPGRPKGKTMKEFAREYLMLKTDDEKKEWLEKHVNGIDVWKMAEGMPKQDVEMSGELVSKVISVDE